MANSNLLLQCLLGMQCKDFTIIAADQLTTQSVVILKDDVDKIFELSDRVLLGVNGDAGEVAQFTQYIVKNLQLYKMKNKYELDQAAVVHFSRTNLIDTLRNGSAPMLNMLFATYDKQVGCRLYTMDSLAACLAVPCAAHGVGGILGMSILDEYYKSMTYFFMNLALTVQQAYDVIKLCVYEIQHRLFMNLPNFKVKIVSDNGIRTLPNINTATFVK